MEHWEAGKNPVKRKAVKKTNVPVKIHVRSMSLIAGPRVRIARKEAVRLIIVLATMSVLIMFSPVVQKQ